MYGVGPHIYDPVTAQISPSKPTRTLLPAIITVLPHKRHTRDIFGLSGTIVNYTCLPYLLWLALETEARISSKKAVKIRDYDSHVLLCTSGDCKKRGAKKLRKALKNELREARIKRDVRVDSVDCLGLCKHGPNAVVYPSGTWYLGLEGDDLPEIVEKHLGGGEPVERLAAERRTVKPVRKK